MDQQKYILNPFVISIIFLIAKLGEMKFFLKENKPIKELVKEIILVFISGVLGTVVMEQLDIVTIKPTNIFTGAPDF
jgi:TctA family transporter